MTRGCMPRTSSALSTWRWPSRSLSARSAPHCRPGLPGRAVSRRRDWREPPSSTCSPGRPSAPMRHCTWSLSPGRRCLSGKLGRAAPGAPRPALPASRDQTGHARLPSGGRGGSGARLGRPPNHPGGEAAQSPAEPSGRAGHDGPDGGGPVRGRRRRRGGRVTATAGTADAPATRERAPDAAPAGQGTREVELAIEGMTCAACAVRIEKKLNKLAEVRAAVNYATATARVTAPAAMPVAELVVAVQRAGYTGPRRRRAETGRPRPEDPARRAGTLRTCGAG